MVLNTDFFSIIHRIKYVENVRCRLDCGEEEGEGEESWLQHPIQEDASSGDGLDDDDDDGNSLRLSPENPTAAPSADLDQSEMDSSHFDQPVAPLLDQPDLALFDPFTSVDGRPLDDQTRMVEGLTNECLLSMVPVMPRSHGDAPILGSDGFGVQSDDLAGDPVGRKILLAGSGFLEDLPDIAEGPGIFLPDGADSDMVNRGGTSAMLDSSTAASMHNDFSTNMAAAPRARTGSIVESGRGDLTESPCDAAASGPESRRKLSSRADIVNSRQGSQKAQNGSEKRLGAVEIQSNRGDIGQAGVKFHSGSRSVEPARAVAGGTRRALETQESLVGWEAGVDQTGYILDAAKLIWQALEAEQEGEYRAAFAQYKCAIAMLLKGVQG